MSEQYISPRIAEQTTKNLALARRFLAEVLEDEEILDAIPEEARIVLVPADDPDLARMNFEMAVSDMFHGRPVALQLVGGLRPEVDAWRAADRRHLLMHEIRFPTRPLHAADVAIVYDQPHDTLMVNFAPERHADVLGLEVAPHIILRIDSESYEIVGYLIASYLQAEAHRSPTLARALRKAEFRSLTPEELGDVEIVRQSDTPFDNDEAAAVASDFVRWITPRRSNEGRTRDSA